MCPVCNGEGEEALGSVLRPSSTSQVLQERSKCDGCKGSGRVYKLAPQVVGKEEKVREAGRAKNRRSWHGSRPSNSRFHWFSYVFIGFHPFWVAQKALRAVVSERHCLRSPLLLAELRCAATAHLPLATKRSAWQVLRFQS